MDNFYTIRFRRNTAQRFKRFSKKVSNSYSESMEMVINFFEWHGFLPSEKFEKSISKEILKNRRRTEAVIAIIREIEKNQTKPTKSMLELLFEHSHQKKPEQAPLLIGSHDHDPEMDVFYKKVDQALILERENTNLKRGLKQNRAELKALLNKVQLDIDPKDFEKLKIKIEK
ncbi:hypothetical protein KCTC52924_02740 [Arenibacter antarcticus]|uniref:BfmA/BtgA family mobilization protein n=1 Tax=Arenibacter antarcticus TaxID=2040469 RepID=A0ABW5VGC6_9FLAO|nr:BfmA/BtgA family mobilization protein [Arenibacter sp. H213]MCM4167160.1 hypothetical protein [Arenibacter sp. H213]